MLTKYIEPTFESFSDNLLRLFPNDFTSTHEVLSLTFQVTEDCCMACTYCYQLNKKPHRMTFEVAKKFIDDLLNDKNELINTSNTMSVCLDFIGGEPFMKQI